MPRRRALLIGLAAGLSAPALQGLLPRPALAAGPLRAGDAGELARVLARCSGGETVALAGGDWEPVTLEGLRFDPPVTLRAETPDAPPVLPRLALRDCAGLELRALHFAYRFQPGQEWRETPFAVSGCRAVSFTGCVFRGDTGAGSARGVDITGAPWGNGPRLRDCTDSHLVRCRITGFRQGAVVAQSAGCSIQGCRIEANGNDNVRLVEIRDMLVEGNYLGQQASHPDEPFHNDHIHHFNNNATTPSERVTIRRNLLYSARDAVRDSAGMMLQNYIDAPLKDWTVAENVVIGRAQHGISLWPVEGAVVRHNTLIRWHTTGRDEPDRKSWRQDTPRINIRKGSRGVLLEGNITPVELLWRDSQVTNRGNVVIPPERYASAFLQPDPGDPRGWTVRPGGPGQGMGSPLMW